MAFEYRKTKNPHEIWKIHISWGSLSDVSLVHPTGDIGTGRRFSAVCSRICNTHSAIYNLSIIEIVRSGFLCSSLDCAGGIQCGIVQRNFCAFCICLFGNGIYHFSWIIKNAIASLAGFLCIFQRRICTNLAFSVRPGLSYSVKLICRCVGFGVVDVEPALR